MTLYYAAMGMLFGARAFFVNRKGRTDFLYWSTIIAVYLFVAFRWQVGCDWGNYARHYYAIPSRSITELFEQREGGYWLMLQTFRDLNWPLYSLNLATSALFFAGLHWLARRQTDPLGFLVLAFPFLIVNIPMSGIRQAAGVGFVCLAFVAFIDRQPFRYVGWLVLGSLFHSSTLFFLPFVTFIYGTLATRDVLLSALLSVPFVYVIVSSAAADTAVDRYLGTDVESFGAPFRLGILAITAACYFTFLNRNWARLFPVDHKLVTLGAALMILLAVLSPVSSTVADRLGYYLIPLQLMIFSRMPFLFSRRSREIATFTPYVALALLFVFWTQNSWHFQSCYVPYDSVLIR